MVAMTPEWCDPGDQHREGPSLPMCSVMGLGQLASRPRPLEGTEGHGEGADRVAKMARALVPLASTLPASHLQSARPAGRLWGQLWDTRKKSATCTLTPCSYRPIRSVQTPANFTIFVRTVPTLIFIKMCFSERIPLH